MKKAMIFFGALLLFGAIVGCSTNETNNVIVKNRKGAIGRPGVSGRPGVGVPGRPGRP